MATMIVNSEERRKRLLKRFHTLLGLAKIDDNGKHEIVASFGHTSSRDMTIGQLIEACNAIDRLLNAEATKKRDKADHERKKVMAAIRGWLFKTGKRDVSNSYVIGIALRSAGDYKKFNDIPISRLRDVYSEFCRKQEVVKRVKAVKEEVLV